MDKIISLSNALALYLAFGLCCSKMYGSIGLGQPSTLGTAILYAVLALIALDLANMFMDELTESKEE